VTPIHNRRYVDRDRESTVQSWIANKHLSEALQGKARMCSQTHPVRKEFHMDVHARLK